jgi:hypothetical protein
MKQIHLVALLMILAFTSCSTLRHASDLAPRTAAEVAATLPPIKVPVLQSPVDLRTAVLTLPADALADMSWDGRRNFLAHPCGDFDEANRRMHLYNDNPNYGIDAKSMLYLRLFEDEQGRTIAASHAARPQADQSAPSAKFTKVYRLENRKWRDITASALAKDISMVSFFRFDQLGSTIAFGDYTSTNPVGGVTKNYAVGKATNTMKWQRGAFRAIPKN